MKTKLWGLSLILPLISIVASIVFVFYGIAIFFNLILGLIVGGLVPLIMIVREKVDISHYFVVKIILSGALVAGIILSWNYLYDWYFEGFYRVFILPIVFLILELVFALTRKAETQQKICIFLSSLVFVYLGGVIDFLLLFSKLL